MPEQIGPYRLLRLLGEGGMGSVFEAVHKGIERRVAIKLLKGDYARDAEASARFLNEARAANRVEHPSLVQISESGQTADGAIYLIMEFLRGETLQARMNRLGKAGERMPFVQVVDIVGQIAEGLAAAHAKGVIHRDIKPSNLMLVEDAACTGGHRAKILDFGLAKLVQTSQVLTIQGRPMGTPMYMAPEQIRAAVSIDGRTDVYSLGVVTYELLAGRPPFKGDRIESLIGQHLFVDPVQLLSVAPETPKPVAELVHRMLCKEQADRPTMAEVMTALRSLGGLPPRSAVSYGRIESPPAPPASLAPSDENNPDSTLARSAGQGFLRGPGGARGRLLGGAAAGALLLLVAGLTGRLLLRPAPAPAVSAPPPVPSPAAPSPAPTPPLPAAAPLPAATAAHPEKAPPPGRSSHKRSRSALHAKSSPPRATPPGRQQARPSAQKLNPYDL